MDVCVRSSVLMASWRLWQELEQWASQKDDVRDDDVDSDEALEEEGEARGGRQGSGRRSVPLSTYGPQGYGLEAVREEDPRQGSMAGAGEEDDGAWRQYGRYGRTVEYVAAQVMLLDARGLQAQGLAHILSLLGESGKLRADRALYMHCRALILDTPKELFAEVPFALALLLRGLVGAGAADEEVHRHLAGTVEPMNTRHVNDKMLLDLLEGFEALDALHEQNRILNNAATNARPLDQVYRRNLIADKSDWLRRVTGGLKLKAAHMPLNKWTPQMLAKFAWCARRSTGDDPGVVLPGEDPQMLQDEHDADHEFEAYVSRAVINTDPEALDGASAAALLAYHARTDHVVGPAQQRQDRLVLTYVADAVTKHIDASRISLSDWVTILQAATQLRRPPRDAGAAAEQADAAQAPEAEEEEAALGRLFDKAGTRLLDARLVLAQKASAGAYGDGGAAAGAGTEVSLAESVSLLTSFARHPAAAPPGTSHARFLTHTRIAYTHCPHQCSPFLTHSYCPMCESVSVSVSLCVWGGGADGSVLSLSLALAHAVVNSLSELLAAAPSATFAAAPPLLARLSSLLPALYSAHSGPAVDSLLKVFAAALAQVPAPSSSAPPIHVLTRARTHTCTHARALTHRTHHTHRCRRQGRQVVEPWQRICWQE